MDPDLSASPAALPRTASEKAGFQACDATTITQTLSLMAFTGKAFTTLRAGFAFTMTTLPKTSRLPAFVAGFVLAFSLQRPGSVKTPAFVTSAAASSAKLLIIFAHTDFFNSQDVAKASAIAPFVMLFAVFMAFMGAMATWELACPNARTSQTCEGRGHNCT